MGPCAPYAIDSGATQWRSQDLILGGAVICEGAKRPYARGSGASEGEGEGGIPLPW